jgi:hypothetical protein
MNTSIKSKPSIRSILLLLSVIAATRANGDIRSTNVAFVTAWHADNMKEAATNRALHALPRVRVDLAAHTVSFYAEATGNSPREPVEFFLIGEESGNAYEAIAVALADPAQINKGLQMLGLPPGRSADPVATRFWSKGERVIMTFNGIRAETLIRDTRTGKPLAANGFVYTGSRIVPSEEGSTTTVLAAQSRPPYSIASNYNEPDSLLDVPWQAPQTAVYSHQILNEDFLFKPGERIHVTISPEYPDGKRRVQDLQLTIGTAAATGHAPTIADALFRLANRTAGTNLLAKANIEQLMAGFNALIGDGRDPFVEITLDPELPLGLIRQTCAVLRTIDTENGIRIEPPVPGELYYKAFTPNEQFRQRRDRHIQPWELHLAATGGTGVLTRIDEHWTRGEPKPDLTTEDTPINSTEDLLQTLSTKNPDVRGIYVFAPSSLTYGELMRLIRPVLPTHPHVHVYIEESTEPLLRTPPSIPEPPTPDPPAADPPSPL